jgi:hypothetical protein
MLIAEGNGKDNGFDACRPPQEGRPGSASPGEIASGLIREALRGMLDGKHARRQAWRQALAPLRDLEEHWVGKWDSTDIIRYYRNTRYGCPDRR